MTVILYRVAYSLQKICLLLPCAKLILDKNICAEKDGSGSYLLPLNCDVSIVMYANTPEFPYSVSNFLSALHISQNWSLLTIDRMANRLLQNPNM